MCFVEVEDEVFTEAAVAESLLVLEATAIGEAVGGAVGGTVGGAAVVVVVVVGERKASLLEISSSMLGHTGRPFDATVNIA